jgi:hypothetical protein
MATMVGATLLWAHFLSREGPQPMRRIPMMTLWDPARHNLRRQRDHDVMGRGKGPKLANLVANLNVNGVNVVTSLLGSFRRIRQPEGRLLCRGRGVTPVLAPLRIGFMGRSLERLLVCLPMVVMSLRLVVTSFRLTSTLRMDISPSASAFRRSKT